jgi:CheY-like chemotaxis protein
LQGILLTGDLIFATKVTGTASALGLEVAVARTAEALADLCHERRPGVILLDLGSPVLESEAAIADIRQAVGDVPVMAYGPHVQRERLAAAAKAGYEVMPRSKFAAELPDILRRFQRREADL